MLSTLSTEDLRQLGRQRWLVAVMARFARQRGQRFAELLRAIGLPRDSLVRSLESLQELGWLQRNPGHGHPLRPEYLLTAKGEAIAEAAAQIDRALAGMGVESNALNRWSLPALWALGQGNDRFNDLARTLSPATPRALSQTLRTLVANDLVDREIEAGFPPSSRYRLTRRGRLIAG